MTLVTAILFFILSYFIFPLFSCMSVIITFFFGLASSTVHIESHLQPPEFTKPPSDEGKLWNSASFNKQQKTSKGNFFLRK